MVSSFHVKSTLHISYAICHMLKEIQTAHSRLDIVLVCAVCLVVEVCVPRLRHVQLVQVVRRDLLARPGVGVGNSWQ